MVEELLQNIQHFSLLEMILAGALGALIAYQLYYYIRYMAGVQRRVRHQEKKRFRWKKEQPELTPEQKPGVSVVVCARNEGDNLRHYLQALTCQKYPTFEVIVVNDASEDDTQLVLDHYTQLFRNLRLTFVPGDAWVRSSKKLALTLAAKAAQYDILLDVINTEFEKSVPRCSMSNWQRTFCRSWARCFPSTTLPMMIFHSVTNTRISTMN